MIASNCLQLFLHPLYLHLLLCCISEFVFVAAILMIATRHQWFMILHSLYLLLLLLHIGRILPPAWRSELQLDDHQTDDHRPPHHRKTALHMISHMSNHLISWRIRICALCLLIGVCATIRVMNKTFLKPFTPQLQLSNRFCSFCPILSTLVAQCPSSCLLLLSIIIVSLSPSCTTLETVSEEPSALRPSHDRQSIWEAVENGQQTQQNQSHTLFLRNRKSHTPILSVCERDIHWKCSAYSCKIMIFGGQKGLNVV